MKRDASTTRNAGTRRVVPLVISTAVVACSAGLLHAGATGDDGAPFPFLWRGVALVHFVCALPLASMLTVLLRRLPTKPAGLAAALVASSLALAVQVAGDAYSSNSSVLSGAVLRSALSLGAASLVLLVLFRLFSLPSRQAGNSPVPWVALGVLALAALVVPPTMYVEGRCHHDLARVADLLEQSRLGEANILIEKLLALQPAAKLQGRPVRELAANLQRIIADLDSHVASPLTDNATDESRMERAQQLAILGKTSLAIAALDALHTSSPSPEVCGLYGTIYEMRAQWAVARDWYRRANRGWQASPPSPQRSDGLQKATTGVAFCERKLGRYIEAEAAWQELLALAPTADSHFLLAQFYEDTQQASRAHFHARQAMALAPLRYGEPGRKLIDKLVTQHFGCLSVYFGATQAMTDVAANAKFAAPK
ncbi:MAG: hypothetical protein ACTHOU_09765 [Aureliella sp.]